MNLTPAEEGAGAGAALGLVSSLYLFRQPNLAEIALGSLVGAAVGYLGVQAYAMAMGGGTTWAGATPNPGPSSPAGTTPAPATATPPNPSDAGGGSSSF